MDDKKIINLYFERKEEAIKETDLKYGNYCKTISYNILRNSEDVKECVNDTYLNTWNSIPPEKPSMFRTYLGKICRNLSIDRLRILNAKKRGGGEVELVFSELEGCIPHAMDTEKRLVWMLIILTLMIIQTKKPLKL